MKGVYTGVKSGCPRLTPLAAKQSVDIVYKLKGQLRSTNLFATQTQICEVNTVFTSERVFLWQYLNVLVISKSYAITCVGRVNIFSRAGLPKGWVYLPGWLIVCQLIYDAQYDIFQWLEVLSLVLAELPTVKFADKFPLFIVNYGWTHLSVCGLGELITVSRKKARPDWYFT